ncbi:MAG: hypothetical protein WCO48_02135 [Candidatus Taylorbacteria bacterium]
MDEKPSMLVDLFSELWKVWSAMFGHLMEIAPKVFHFTFWALSAIIILPAVFIAGTLYPMWVEWGEDF